MTWGMSLFYSSYALRIRYVINYPLIEKMNNIRVAVVDDNPLYLFALVTLLKQNNDPDVVIATDNFKDFLEQLSEEDPDLIILMKVLWGRFVRMSGRVFSNIFGKYP